MAFTPLGSGQTDADSPLDQALMDLIRTNLDDLDARLTLSAFSVHKNGANQGGIVTSTWTKVTWPTELFDSNGDFGVSSAHTSAAADRFAPTVAGKYLLSGTLQYTATNASDQSRVGAAIYKNGSRLRSKLDRTSGNATDTVAITLVVDADGSSDYFELWTFQDAGADRIIEGTTESTFFSGVKGLG